MNIQEAKEFINYCIRHGDCDPEVFEDMSDEQIIKWADYMSQERDNYEE